MAEILKHLNAAQQPRENENVYDQYQEVPEHAPRRVRQSSRRNKAPKIACGQFRCVFTHYRTVGNASSNEGLALKESGLCATAWGIDETSRLSARAIGLSNEAGSGGAEEAIAAPLTQPNRRETTYPNDETARYGQTTDDDMAAVAHVLTQEVIRDGKQREQICAKA